MRKVLTLATFAFALALTACGGGGGGSSALAPAAPGGTCAGTGCAAGGTAAGGSGAAAGGPCAACTAAGAAVGACAVSPTPIATIVFPTVPFGGSWCTGVGNYVLNFSYPALTDGAGTVVSLTMSGAEGPGFSYPPTPAAVPPGHTGQGTVFFYLQLTPLKTIAWTGDPAISLWISPARAHSEYDLQLFDISTGATIDAGHVLTATPSISGHGLLVSQAATFTGTVSFIANHTYDFQFVYY